MASISINSLNNYSSLFGTSSSFNSSNSLLSSNFYADAASIRNGSYAKLTKAYYGKNSSSSSSVADATDANKLKLQFSSVKSVASDLSKAASKLADEDLYKKITVKDKDGNEAEDYDWDKITSAVKSYVDSYNSFVEESGDSDSKSILSSTLSLVKNTAANENLLSKIGISIDSDNKLSLDEDVLKKADISTVKTLFSGTGSFGDRVTAKANSVERVANNSINKLGNYNSSAAMSSLGLTGSIYDSLY